VWVTVAVAVVLPWLGFELVIFGSTAGLHMWTWFPGTAADETGSCLAVDTVVTSAGMKGCEEKLQS